MGQTSNKDGWDIRLQCTVCGTRVRRHRNDYAGLSGDSPPATVMTGCSNCTCEAGHPREEVQTLHFVDFASPEELKKRS
jgi:hypothetical protein